MTFGGCRRFRPARLPACAAGVQRRPDGWRLGASSSIDSFTRYDRFTKRRLYQDVKIPAYWIVDADARHVEVWTPKLDSPRIEKDRVIWSPVGDTESFTVELEELFKAVG